MKRLTYLQQKHEGSNEPVTISHMDFEALHRMAYAAKELAEWTAGLPPELFSRRDENHCADCAINEIEDAAEYLDGGDFPWD